MTVLPGGDHDGPPWSNGGADPTMLRDRRSVGLHALQISHDASTLVTELKETAADSEYFLIDRMKHQPYSTLGAAAAVGYILGGGLRTRFTLVLLGAASRLVGVLAMRELGNRIAPRRPSTDHRWEA